MLYLYHKASFFTTKMLAELFTNPLSFLIWLIALLVAIDIHEYSHAWMADRLGDPTARLNGRLTLNPLAHLDPIGTLALLLFRLGWGKPVPVDSYNLDNPRRDGALISLAGPLSNLILATILALALKIPLISQYPSILVSLILPIIFLNVSLAIFNLLPIPPLDGSKILLGVLPGDLSWQIEEIFREYGMILLILLLIPLGGSPLIARLVFPVIEFVLGLLL